MAHRASLPKRGTLSRWAGGNKRQKAKMKAWRQKVCGCTYCCPEDLRREKELKALNRDRRIEGW